MNKYILTVHVPVKAADVQAAIAKAKNGLPNKSKVVSVEMDGNPDVPISEEMHDFMTVEIQTADPGMVVDLDFVQGSYQQMPDDIKAGVIAPKAEGEELDNMIANLGSELELLIAHYGGGYPVERLLESYKHPGEGNE